MEKKISSYKIAKFLLKIKGNEEANELRDYFKENEVLNTIEHYDENHTIMIEFVSDESEFEFSPRFYSLSGAIGFDNDHFMVKSGAYTYCVKNLFKKDKETQILISWGNVGRLKQAAYMVYNSVSPGRLDVHNKKEDRLNRIAHYGVLWYLIALSLLKQECVFVHSGVVEKKDEAVILAGSGGCGKTSTIMELLQREGWKYISEDFAIISAEGKVYNFPRKLAIYASDLRFGNIALNQGINNNLTFFERFKWYFFDKLGKDPLYHLRPSQVLGNNKLADSADISKVFFLTRISIGSFIARKDITDSELNKRICSSSFREIKEMFEIILNVQANGDAECAGCFPTIEDIYKNYEEILSKAFSKAEKGLILVPLNSAPNHIIERICE